MKINTKALNEASRYMLREMIAEHKNRAQREQVLTVYAHFALTDPAAPEEVEIVETVVRERCAAIALHNLAEVERLEVALQKLDKLSDSKLETDD